MELPQFKLSLSGIYAKKDLSGSTLCDENSDPRHKAPFTERQQAYKLMGKTAKSSPKPAPASQPSDLLLQLDDSRDDSERMYDENSLSLDNQEFYPRHGPKRRMVSRLDAPYERERKMSQTMSEFLKKSTEIQMELWGKQQDEADKSLFEGSIAQALSPHFPNGLQNEFLKSGPETDCWVDQGLLKQVNECLIQRNLKQLDHLEAANSQFLLQLLRDILTELTPFPLVFTKEVEVGIEEKSQFAHLFSRKAQNCAFDQAVLKAVGYYHAFGKGRDEEVRDLQRELQKQIHNCKSQERENKRNWKTFAEKLTQLETTNAGLRRELEARRSSKEPNSESSRARSKSPLHSVPSNEASAVLGEICHILAIKHPHHILRSISKLAKIVRSVPKLERFATEAYGFLCPDARGEERKKGAVDVDLLAGKMKEWAAELASLRAFRGNVGHLVGARAQASEEELLIQLQHPQAASFEHHFRQVFELRASQDAFEASNQLFLQNHELKAFCRSVKQFLGVSEESSLSSLLLLVKQLKRR